MSRTRHGRVGYASGVFDMFHIGHLNILRNSRFCCDHLIAGVLSDEETVRRKGKPTVVPMAERIEIVRNIRFVDEAVEEDVPTRLEMWERLKFDVIIKGGDWRGTEKGHLLEQEFANVDVEIRYLPYTVHTSSTLLRQALHPEIMSEGTASGSVG